MFISVTPETQRSVRELQKERSGRERAKGNDANRHDDSHEMNSMIVHALLLGRALGHQRTGLGAISSRWKLQARHALGSCRNSFEMTGKHFAVDRETLHFIKA